jgi:hypothetical protein
MKKQIKNQKSSNVLYVQHSHLIQINLQTPLNPSQLIPPNCFTTISKISWPIFVIKNQIL